MHDAPRSESIHPWGLGRDNLPVSVQHVLVHERKSTGHGAGGGVGLLVRGKWVASGGVGVDKELSRWRRRRRRRTRDI